ncbi:MAG TPA: hypothetical protein VIT23_15475 [Terrimicrobiaceae bacterium]
MEYINRLSLVHVMVITAVVPLSSCIAVRREAATVTTVTTTETRSSTLAPTTKTTTVERTIY